MIYCVYMLARICSIDCYIDAVLKYTLLKNKIKNNSTIYWRDGDEV